MRRDNQDENPYHPDCRASDARAEIWFDTNWANNDANRVQIATLTGVTQVQVAALTAADFVIYSSTLAPAGVAGSPINLALENPDSQSGDITVTISGVPAGWTLSDGIDNGDGSWTVQTADVSGLAITTLADYSGAVALNVTMSWTKADGTAGFQMITDNVEAYAPGNPIFAISGDDHLTGSAGADQFVFAQPIGEDFVYGFETSQDKVNLIAFTGFDTYVDAVANLANDANGNAVLTLGAGMSITFMGVTAGALGADNFLFNEEPTTVNIGDMIVSDGAFLPLSGVIDNSGAIRLESAGNSTELHLIQQGITLQGGGAVTLSDNGANVIIGSAPDVSLTNVDNTISGAGRIGAGTLTLTNFGTIEADADNALVIDTGTNTIHNSGTLEASGAGGLVIASDVDNSGLIWANGARVDLEGAVSGSGDARIDGVGTIEFSATASADVIFDANASGSLILGDAVLFTGKVSGFNGDDVLHLANLGYDSVTLDYQANLDNSGGTLIVANAMQSVSVTLLGQYDLASFHAAAGENGGTVITYA